jgi:uncharacterized protein (TIGR03790 family)
LSIEGLKMKMSLCGLLAMLTAGFAFGAGSAAGSSANQTGSSGSPGQEVVVVYNSRLPESKALAEYYAQRRQVPASQIFGFALSTNEDISRAEFRDNLQLPLAKALEDNKLWRVGSGIVRATTTQAARVQWKPIQSKIRYAVLCYGIPLRIANDPNLKEEGVENLRPEQRMNGAAVDSELALLPMNEDRLQLAGVFRNPVYSATNVAMLHPTNGVLLVARLDGPTPAIARGLVDKAIQAETDGLWGRAYFDLRNITDPGMKLGDDWIRSASEISRRLGFETVVDNNPDTFPPGFPLSQIAFYVGWYSQDACGPLAQPKVEFMPGAFAYHLHSFSASTLRSTTQGWVGPLLARGATATMGCVAEPYLACTPDMGTFAGRFLYYGFTFGEAACASQPVLSWQITVVGDPLYRPFGKNPELVFNEMVQTQSKWLEWEYLRLANINLASGRQMTAVIGFLDQLPMTKQSAVLSEKLGDLLLAEGRPSAAVDAYVRALKDQPSPQQQVRLRLTLGERLVALEREPEAYTNYQKLLEEEPQYPDKTAIYRKLLPLAQKLGKSADVQKYQAALQPAAK